MQNKLDDATGTFRHLRHIATFPHLHESCPTTPCAHGETLRHEFDLLYMLRLRREFGNEKPNYAKVCGKICQAFLLLCTTAMCLNCRDQLSASWPVSGHGRLVVGWVGWRVLGFVDGVWSWIREALYIPAEYFSAAQHCCAGTRDWSAGDSPDVEVAAPSKPKLASARAFAQQLGHFILAHPVTSHRKMPKTSKRPKGHRDDQENKHFHVQ